MLHVVYTIYSLEAPRPGSRSDPHTCHILPFQPILRNRYLPSEPVTSGQNSPTSISEGGIIWRICNIEPA